MFNAGAFSPAATDAVFALIAMIEDPAAAKEALKHMIAERKKGEVQLAEMRELNDRIVKSQKELSVKEKQVENLREEYDHKLASLIDREQQLRSGKEVLAAEVSALQRHAKATNVVHDQREEIIAQREFEIEKKSAALAERESQVNLRLAAVEQREARIKQVFG